MNPSPEPIFDPFEVGVRIPRLATLKNGCEAFVPFPKNQRILYPIGEIVHGNELQVDMQDRRPIHTNYEAWLTDVLAAESGEERTQTIRDLKSHAHHFSIGGWLYSDDQIKIAELVQTTSDSRASNRDPKEAVVRSESGHGPLQELAV